MSTFASPLAEKSLEFAIELVTYMRPVKGCGAIKDQLLRAGTSIGANIREAQYGYSTDDFVFKLQTALKENAMRPDIGWMWWQGRSFYRQRL